MFAEGSAVFSCMQYNATIIIHQCARKGANALRCSAQKQSKSSMTEF